MFADGLAAFGRPDRDEPCRGEQDRLENSRRGEPQAHGAMATISTGPSTRFTRSPGWAPSSRCANSDWYEYTAFSGLESQGPRIDDVALGSGVAAQAHARAHAHLARIDLRRVENPRARELVGEGRDARREVLVLLPRGVVLEVLAQVAVLFRRLHGLGVGRKLDLLQVHDLLALFASIAPAVA